MREEWLDDEREHVVLSLVEDLLLAAYLPEPWSRHVGLASREIGRKLVEHCPLRAHVREVEHESLAERGTVIDHHLEGGVRASQQHSAAQWLRDGVEQERRPCRRVAAAPGDVLRVPREHGGAVRLAQEVHFHAELPQTARDRDGGAGPAVDQDDRWTAGRPRAGDQPCSAVAFWLSAHRLLAHGGPAERPAWAPVVWRSGSTSLAWC